MDRLSSAMESIVHGLEECYQMELHGSVYVVYVVLRSDDGGEPNEMSIDVELEDAQAAAPSRWSATFGAAYLEEITAKTGNFKKFGTFARMLLKALERSSDSVFVDLLTYEDLEMLRARRNAGKAAGGQAASRGASTHSKRYLILTYTVEFDRVHYPLPLSCEETPSTASLQRTVGRLRRQLAVATTDGTLDGQRSGHAAAEHAGTRQLGRGNTGGGQCSSAEPGRARGRMSVQQDKLRAETVDARDALAALQRDYDELRRDSAAEVRRLKNEVRAQSAIAQQSSTSAVAPSGGGAGGPVALRRRIEELEGALATERASHREAIGRAKREISRLTRELDQEVAAATRMRERLRETQRQLALQSQSKDKPRRGHTPTANGAGANGNDATWARSARGRASSRASSRGSSRASSRASHASRRAAELSDSGASRASTGTRRRSGLSDGERFDPTAYNREKERKQRELARRRELSQRADQRPPSAPHAARTRRAARSGRAESASGYASAASLESGGYSTASGVSSRRGEAGYRSAGSARSAHSARSATSAASNRSRRSNGVSGGARPGAHQPRSGTPPPRMPVEPPRRSPYARSPKAQLPSSRDAGRDAVGATHSAGGELAHRRRSRSPSYGSDNAKRNSPASDASSNSPGAPSPYPVVEHSPEGPAPAGSGGGAALSASAVTAGNAVLAGKGASTSAAAQEISEIDRRLNAVRIARLVRAPSFTPPPPLIPAPYMPPQLQEFLHKAKTSP